MKKRMRMCVAIAAISLAFAGCGGSFPDMTDEEASLVGEYAAITLLKYDASNRSRLVALPEEEPAPAPEVAVPSEEPEPEPETPASEPETPVIEIGAGGNSVDSMESFFDLPEAITLTYAGCEVCQTYSGEDNDYFSLDANAGKSLLVLRFTLQNLSGTDQTVDFLHRDDVYRVTLNETYTRNALPTILPNDLSSYKATLSSGALHEVVLLMEIDQMQAENMSSATLNLKNESKTYTIQLF